MNLMIVEIDKKTNIEKNDVLCMIWVDMNIAQYIIIIHTIDEMKTTMYKNFERQHDISKSTICLIDDSVKLPFSIPIVEYNTHMKRSDGNAQQKSYYSSHRFDNRYWWFVFEFFLKATVLNAYKLWKLLYLDFKMTHLKFQRSIAEELISSTNQTRQRLFNMSIKCTDAKIDAKELTTACKWKHMKKLLYCVPCKIQTAELRKRKAFAEIIPNYSKKRRGSQTKWRCSNCDPCCKKKACWDSLHS